MRPVRGCWVRLGLAVAGAAMQSALAVVAGPLGWGSAPHDSIRIARLAVESGVFPVFEAERGEVTSVSRIRRQVPVEEYLRPQRRFAHLFQPVERRDVIDRIQAAADRTIARYGLLRAAEEEH